MLKINTTVSVYGSSTIEAEGEIRIIAQMNASINDESKGSVNITTSIIDTTAYINNKESVNKDIEEFNEYVHSLIQS